MPTKCCWVIHGSLTSERKASTSLSSLINHSTLLLNRALKRQAPCLFLASLMKEVCTDVRTEPELQPLTGEVFNRATTITTVEARLDIEARGFWECRQECTMFDVRVFNPCADSYRHAPLSTLYRRQEQLKRNAYEERVRQVEKASFVPLVFTTSGSASPAATVVLKRLAAMHRLAEARDLSYSTVMGWLRCRLSFCLLRCAVMCFRGSRSRRTTAPDNVPNLACSAVGGSVQKKGGRNAHSHILRCVTQPGLGTFLPVHAQSGLIFPRQITHVGAKWWSSSLFGILPHVFVFWKDELGFALSA